jgi:hypothetical protein
MERAKMIFCGVAILSILSLLFAFDVPVARAQDVAGLGQGKVKTVMYTHTVQQVKAQGTGYVQLIYNESFFSECDGLGYDYDIWVFDNPDEAQQTCQLYWIGYIDTCLGEQSAVGAMGQDIEDGSGRYAVCYFNGLVKDFKTFSSKGGECDLYDASDNWIGISKNAKLKIKQKNLTKKIKCQGPPYIYIPPEE